MEMGQIEPANSFILLVAHLSAQNQIPVPVMESLLPVALLPVQDTQVAVGISHPPGEIEGFVEL